MACGLICSKACGIFPDQGSNQILPPTLVGRFFTTKAPGKPNIFFIVVLYSTVYAMGASKKILWGLFLLVGCRVLSCVMSKSHVKIKHLL